MAEERILQQNALEESAKAGWKATAAWSGAFLITDGLALSRATTTGSRWLFGLWGLLGLIACLGAVGKVSDLKKARRRRRELAQQQGARPRALVESETATRGLIIRTPPAQVVAAQAASVFRQYEARRRRDARF